MVSSESPQQDTRDIPHAERARKCHGHRFERCLSPSGQTLFQRTEEFHRMHNPEKVKIRREQKPAAEKQHGHYHSRQKSVNIIKHITVYARSARIITSACGRVAVISPFFGLFSARLALAAGQCKNILGIFCKRYVNSSKFP